MTLGFPHESFSLVLSCAFLLLSVVGSDPCVNVRSVGRWIDLPCVPMAFESDVSEWQEWQMGKTADLRTLFEWWDGLTQADKGREQAVRM